MRRSSHPLAGAALLIAPSPYHHIVAGDAYVVTAAVSGNKGGGSPAVGLACASAIAALWFGVPVLAARRKSK